MPHANSTHEMRNFADRNNDPPHPFACTAQATRLPHAEALLGLNFQQVERDF